MTQLHVNDIILLVKEEVIKLQKLITIKQAQKLKISIFENVYDQLTGDSQSQHAIQLLNQCAIPYSKDLFKRIPTNAKNFNRKRIDTLFSPLEIFCQLATPSQLEIIHKFLQHKVDIVYFKRFINSLNFKQHGKK